MRRSFFQKLVGLLFLFLIWFVWYKLATLPLAVIFEPIISPVTTWIHKNYTTPLMNYYLTNINFSPIFLFVIVGIIFIITIIAWRIFYQNRRQKNIKKLESKTADSKTQQTTILLLFLLLYIPTILGANNEIAVKKEIPPKKVTTSTGIYDIQSKDDIHKFTTKQIHELVKMEDNRTRGQGKTPHPILVYCFEERSFKYTGGMYKDTEIKYRLRVPRKIIRGRKYPLVVHLHGVGEAGKDNMLSLAHLHSILPMMIGEEQQDFFLLVTQCPPNNKYWEFSTNKDGNLDVMLAALDDVMNNYPIDERRLSVFGLSSGGHGAWLLIFQYYEKFSAAVITSIFAPDEPSLIKLKSFPIWSFINKNDKYASFESNNNAMQIINRAGGFMKLTQFDYGGHAAWQPAMSECNCFSWLIAQKRGGWFNPPPERKIYTGRSTYNCFVVFFLPLSISVIMLIFQKTPYCERIQERIFYSKLYKNNNNKNKTQNENNKNYNKESIYDFRMWTDFTETKKVEAKLIRVQNEKAWFQLKNGQIKSINIKFFSRFDQELLKTEEQK
ncbi:MAG: hypothetical protein LBC74_06605 [Planctomycetaceae bacterium]|nr:hypothetical protein [Planctomycetaceae bacterium]